MNIMNPIVESKKKHQTKERKTNPTYSKTLQQKGQVLVKCCPKKTPQKHIQVGNIPTGKPT